MRERRSQSLRARLTLWYGVALSTVLVGYSAGIYAYVRQSLFDSLDRELHDDLESVEDDFGGFLAGHGDAMPDRWLLEIWSDDGHRIRTSPTMGDVLPLGTLTSSCKTKRTVFMSDVSADGLSLRSACREISFDGHRYGVRVARSGERPQTELRRLLLSSTIGLPIAVLVAAFGGWFLASRMLRPIELMIRQAQVISANHLAERLHVSNAEDELGRLATTFNGVFSRLEKSFEQMRRFTSDASHELRTPLTAIRVLGEVALKTRHQESEYREVLSSILEEVDLLRDLVDDLLMLSRADSGQLLVTIAPVELAALSHEATQRLEVLAEEKQQNIVVEDGAPTWGAGEGRMLRRALVSLIDNAIKYSPVCSKITISARSNGNRVEVAVADEGPGIPPQFQERIFERFVRLDEARSRQTAGTGLGLAIARALVEAQLGTLTVSSDGAKGATFIISIPRAVPLKGLT